MTATSETETTVTAGSSSEEPAVRLCTHCGLRPPPSNSSWCRTCRNEAAAEYRLRARKRPTTDERTCELEGCEETFTWSSMHPLQVCCCKSHYMKMRHRVQHPRTPAEVLAAGMKRCPKCDTIKTALDFSPSQRVKPGAWCRKCAAEFERKWTRENAARRSASSRRSKAARLLRKCQAHTDDIDVLVAEQQGLCYLCDGLPGEKGFSIDHDHELHERGLKSYRGLACGNCNLSIGNANDDPIQMRLMADRLEARRAELRATVA